MDQNSKKKLLITEWRKARDLVDKNFAKYTILQRLERSEVSKVDDDLVNNRVWKTKKLETFFNIVGKKNISDCDIKWIRDFLNNEKFLCSNAKEILGLESIEFERLFDDPLFLHLQR